MMIPVTFDAPVLDNAPIVFWVSTIPAEVDEQLIPVTAPPVPVELSPVIVLPETVMDVALFEVEPMLMPVTEDCPVMFETVLFDSVVTPFQ